MTFDSLVRTLIQHVLDPLAALLVGAGVVYFLWGVLKYVRQSGGEEDRKEGKKMMTYGIIALAVMLSVWGLVRVVQGTFNLDNSTLPTPIQFP